MALAQTYDSTISSSTEIAFNANTSTIEVHAIDKGIFMKWGTDDVTNANFDHFIPADTTKTFHVGSTTAANFLQEAATAKLVVVED